MRKYSVTLGFGLVTLLMLSSTVHAQLDDRKFEVGGLFTSIKFNGLIAFTAPTTALQDTSIQGIGGRLAYNINDNFAIDAEGSFFPESHLFNEETAQKLQGVVGVKAGVRNKRVGVFGKARPGVMWFGEFPQSGSCSTTLFGSVCGVSHEKDFAMDLGGVVEFYPAERAIIRVDVGDTLIKYPDRTFNFGNSVTTVRGGMRSNFQFSIGFGWRF